MLESLFGQGFGSVGAERKLFGELIGKQDSCLFAKS
jgi:hypothetical protein